MGKNRYSRKKRKKRLVTKSQIFLFLICGLILSSMILSFVSSNADHRDNQNYTIEGIFHNPKVSAIQDIDILTPENDTYKAPMRGYYPGTYGFESIENGEEPNDWNFMGNGGKVIENEDFHNKVVELRIDGTNNLVGINQTLPEKTN